MAAKKTMMDVTQWNSLQEMTVTGWSVRANAWISVLVCAE
jgi:hypothetical protein